MFKYCTIMYTVFKQDLFINITLISIYLSYKLYNMFGIIFIYINIVPKYPKSAYITRALAQIEGYLVFNQSALQPGNAARFTLTLSGLRSVRAGRSLRLLPPLVYTASLPEIMLLTQLVLSLQVFASNISNAI